MQEHIPTLLQETLIPMTSINRITRHHRLGRLHIARIQQANQIYGIARRIGFTGQQDDALAIYRLKVFDEKSRKFTMQPDLFVVMDGYFTRIPPE